MTETTIDRATDEAAIKAVLGGVYEAWDAYDADAFVADYNEDATAIMPGTPLLSREAIRESMAVGFSSYFKGTTTSDELMSLRFLGRDAAVVITRTGVLGQGETEAPPERTSYATWVLEKKDGAWLLAAYHNCPTQASR